MTFIEEYNKKYGPMKAAMVSIDAQNPETKPVYDTLVELCQRNIWLKKNGVDFQDDPFMEADYPYSFCRFDHITHLKLFFEHGNWSIRQGVVFGDLFFCNQVNGGDEWWSATRS